MFTVYNPNDYNVAIIVSYIFLISYPLSIHIDVGHVDDISLDNQDYYTLRTLALLSRLEEFPASCYYQHSSFLVYYFLSIEVPDMSWPIPYKIQ
jgi:hypothetical protein